MSNHIHLVVTDVEGRIPDFSHWFFKFTGTVINASLGRWGSFWEQSEKPSMVRLTSPEAIVDKIAYVMANPVSAGLVDSPKKWPGLAAFFKGKKAKTIKRPNVYFRPNGNIPAREVLALTRPPGFAPLSDKELVTHLDEAVHQKVSDQRVSVFKSRRKFIGARRVLQQKRWKCPETYEKRRGISPRVAGKNKWARVEALIFLKEWYEQYRIARNAFLAGKRSTVFPAGTFAMRVRQGVNCEPCPGGGVG